MRERTAAVIVARVLKLVDVVCRMSNTVCIAVKTPRNNFVLINKRCNLIGMNIRVYCCARSFLLLFGADPSASRCG